MNITVENGANAPTIQLVVAYSANRVIGRDNTLPWRLPSDLAHFKRTTLGHPIVMGRNTWESLGRPLPGRPNLVVSRNAGYQPQGATAYPSLEAALAACASSGKVCVIGGEQLFRHALDLAHEVVATEIHANIEGDTFFPTLDPAIWEETERQPQAEENGLTFDFVSYKRRSGT
ncbi:MAG TPA: dihydrofolate reductase [Pusillimonas sp.]